MCYQLIKLGGVIMHEQTFVWMQFMLLHGSAFRIQVDQITRFSW